MADLFDNPYAKAAWKKLTPEEQEKYRKMGEMMYSTDFTSAGTDGGSQEDRLQECAANILSALKSGLTPGALTAEEREVMRKVRGEEWYADLGFEHDFSELPLMAKVSNEGKKKRRK